jgi:hypothetical protein
LEANAVNGASPGSGVACASRSEATVSIEGVGSARGGGGTAPGGRSVAVAVAPSSSPNVFRGARAARKPEGAGAAAAGGLLLPSTPKLEGARVSRAGSRVSDAGCIAVGDAGGSTTSAPAALAGAPVPCAPAALFPGAAAAAPSVPTGLTSFRCGGGGGAAALPSVPFAVAGLSALGALAGCAAGRGGGFGDSVKDDSALWTSVSSHRSHRAFGTVQGNQRGCLGRQAVCWSNDDRALGSIKSPRGGRLGRIHCAFGAPSLREGCGPPLD